MGRRIGITAALVGIAGLLVAGLGAGGLASPRGIDQEENIVVIETTTNGKAHFFGDQPFRPGDIYVFRSVLNSEDGAAKVGSLRVSCAVTFDHRDLCTNAYLVTGRGEIMAQGTIPDAELHPGGQWDLAVTGGSGDFENVRGSVHVEYLNTEGQTRQTIHLIP